MVPFLRQNEQKKTIQNNFINRKDSENILQRKRQKNIKRKIINKE